MWLLLFGCCNYWIWSNSYGSSLPSWNVAFLRTPQKNHLVLDLVHNIFCKQNLVASNSLLGNITFLKMIISLWVQPQLVLAKYYTVLWNEYSPRGVLSLKAIGTHGVVLRYQQSTSIKIFTYICVRCLFSAVHSTSNSSGETRKPEMVLSFYVYVHLVFKVYTCMSYLRNVMCVKWELQCKEKKTFHQPLMKNCWDHIKQQ